MNNASHAPHKRSWQALIRRWLQPHCTNLEELQESLRQAERDGIIDSHALSMISGSLTVANMHVREIMIPYAQITFIRSDTSLSEFLPMIKEANHSRYPVIDPHTEEVKGILLAKDLIAYLNDSEEDASFSLKELLRSAVFVPESKRLNALLQQFRNTRNHMAMVVDEYGKITGLITIEDILEQIVGTIDDEHDVAGEHFIRPIHHRLFTVMAQTPIEEFNEYFSSQLNTEESDTIGGLLLDAFGRVPKRGERIQLHGFEFKILRSDPKQIHLVQVS